MNMTKFLRIFALGLFLIGLLAQPAALLASGPAQDAKSLEWQRLDVDITVQQNGDLRILERNVVRFTSGTFSFGYRDIQQNRITGITDIALTEGSESGEPMRFETSTADGGDFRIKYYFNTPARNEVRTFTMAYTISGAVRYYDGGDQVWWTAIYADRSGFPVKNAAVTVNLPPSATAQKAESYGVPANVTTESGDNVVHFEVTEPIPSGTAFEVRVQFPHGIVLGTAPAWQSAFDAQQTYDEQVRPRNDLIALLVGVLALIGGPALAVVTWVTRGRDPNVGLIAEYLTEAPNVTPGVAGTLVDEKVDMQDIIATMVDLARRGVIVMEEVETKDAFSTMDYNLERGPEYGKAALKQHETALLDALNLDDKPRKLSGLKNNFYTKISKINKALYAQLVADGFYDHDPESTRNRWNGIGVTVLVLAGVLSCGAIFALSSLTNYAFCAPIGLVLTAVIFLVMARNMPQRTRAGAEMKMRLEAFKRYLQNIEKYTNLKEATDQFDKYLPFAIAFGIDRSWVQKFSAVQTPVPPWYVPIGYPRYYPYGYGNTRSTAGGTSISDAIGGARGDISGAARAPGVGGLEGINKGMVVGLAAINTNLTGMFQSVTNTLTSQPAAVVSRSTSSWGGGSSGGWSGGGGGGGGGGSGGGGGGFG